MTFFNAHHAPIGAFATFTFGMKGPAGGLGLELGGPANESLYIGVEEQDRPGQYRALPFFPTHPVPNTSEQDYDVEGLADFSRPLAVHAYADEDVSRTLGASIDEWRAGDLTLRVVSPVRPVPDPALADNEALKAALVPAVTAELTIDNRSGTLPRKAFFGYTGSDRTSGMRVWREGDLIGIGQGTRMAIVTRDATAYGGVGWQPEIVLDPRHMENLSFMLGNTGVLVATVPAGEIKTIRFAICFYREGVATTGISTRYLYHRWFDSISQVADFALNRACEVFEEAEEFDRKFTAHLSSERTLMAAQAVRSYYGSTQCLETEEGGPLWIVNEGEYRMMNTLDLTVDQAFLELALNPWTVRNELDLLADRHSYEDRIRQPGEEASHPGGIAFCHDVGVANTFAEPGRSSYELAGLRGCFSYMSCEELVNWVLCSCLYLSHTSDFGWADSRRQTLSAALQSLTNRDHPDQDQRNGVMGLDGARCEGGKEITTYDSLDASLGQARNNVYLAVKCWAAYVLLEPVLLRLGEDDLANQAARQAALCADTICASANEDGLLPAILGEGVEARIIPAIEGLVYPLVAGYPNLVAIDGPYGALRRTLERHFDAVLKPGICLFEDGGWKLSSTSRNSWLSKIYLCQFVAERLFGKSIDQAADQAHLSWLMDEDNAYYAWSDQMLAGKAVGSRYYPRGVTSILWLSQGSSPLKELKSGLTGTLAPSAALF